MTTDYYGAAATKNEIVSRVYMDIIQGTPHILNNTPEHRAACMALRHAFCFSKAMPRDLAAAAFVLPTLLVMANDDEESYLHVHAEDIDDDGDVCCTRGWIPTTPGPRARVGKYAVPMHADAVSRINAVAATAGWHQGHSPDSMLMWLVPEAVPGGEA